MKVIMANSPVSYELRSNIYDEDLDDDTICDFSSMKLDVVPDIKNKLIRVLYLQNNNIKILPNDLLPSLPSLMYLDLRNNELIEIPKSIQSHPSLTHLLLQNNKLTSLPNELGTVNLKVLQLNGNRITYPPEDILKYGVKEIIIFLHNKYVDYIFNQSHSDISEDVEDTHDYNDFNQESQSYNSVIDRDKVKGKMSVQLGEKDIETSDDENYERLKGNCPRLAKSRKKTPTYYQSAKYLGALDADSKEVLSRKIKQGFAKDYTIKKHKDLLATQEKILQGRKNMEMLRKWRKSYRGKQQFANPDYRLQSTSIPYDTSPEYMTLLTREDIERDLPDKYRKKLVRRCKPSVPRKSTNDVHLAMKIKKLFENLETIDMNKETLTPRTEQKMLLGEIQKITEIKQKLTELSLTNRRSVIE